MAKRKTKNEYPEKLEKIITDEEINYSTELDKSEDIKTETKEIKEEVKKSAEEIAIEFAKPYMDEDGNFYENGKRKYYIKHKSRKQIIKNGKMIFEDDGTECPYFENLLPDEVKRRREAGQIF